jgi:hypothetical protein
MKSHLTISPNTQDVTHLKYRDAPSEFDTKSIPEKSVGTKSYKSVKRKVVRKFYTLKVPKGMLPTDSRPRVSSSQHSQNGNESVVKFAFQKDNMSALTLANGPFKYRTHSSTEFESTAFCIPLISKPFK